MCSMFFFYLHLAISLFLTEGFVPRRRFLTTMVVNYPSLRLGDGPSCSFFSCGPGSVIATPPTGE